MSSLAPFPIPPATEPTGPPLLPAEFAVTLGSTIVFAPHPDDESLGCGGLLALLAATDCAPQVVVMTDGSRSHPHSLSFPASRLAALREVETLLAMEALGLPAASLQFLRYPDCGLPAKGSADFNSTVDRLRSLLRSFAPETILVPGRGDPHCDHAATWEVLHAAVARLPNPPRWLEYPVWGWIGAANELAEEIKARDSWRIDISPVLQRKQAAIAQHRSQLGAVIQDDPAGFVLPPAMLAHFAQPWELFITPACV